MTDALLTIRDFFRYAVSRFRAADLSFGHGAADAVDEAAYIALEALSLPIDDINPWLDARLTEAERRRLTALIDARVETRAPAAYLLKRAYIRGMPFYVDERVIVPRSYIGELLVEGLTFLDDPQDVRTVLDLCTGSGCLAILAAEVFPEAQISAADISGDALAVARRNIDDYGLGDRITLFEGDLFGAIGNRRYDLIIANPPYVGAEAMSRLPAEYRAEPALALAGGEDGLDLVRRILAGARAHLTDRGGLLVEFGEGRHILEQEYPSLDFFWPDTEGSEGEVFWLDAADLD